MGFFIQSAWYAFQFGVALLIVVAGIAVWEGCFGPLDYESAPKTVALAVAGSLVTLGLPATLIISALIDRLKTARVYPVLAEPLHNRITGSAPSDSVSRLAKNVPALLRRLLLIR